MKLKSAILPLLCGCLATLPLVPAEAGVPVSASSKSVVIPPAPPQDDWYVKLAVYMWATSVEGDAAINGIPFSADMKFKDLFEELDFGYQGYFEVGKGRWSLGLDAIFARLSDDETFAAGPFNLDASSEQKQALLTARVQYRLIDDDRCNLDVFAGIRWNYFDVDLDIEGNLGLGGIHVSDTENWVDPIVGFRSDIDLSEKWFLRLMGDIGGFGAASDLTWQAMAGFGYYFKENCAGFIGYRALGVDYEDDGFVMDTVTYGPLIGVAIRF